MDMKIKIVNHGKIMEIECQDNETILDALKREDIYVPAYCAGRGTCRKCRIQLLEGDLEVTQADQKAFDAASLAQGVRLSCQARPKTECTILLCTEDESDFDILTTGAISADKDGKAPGTGTNAKDKEAFAGSGTYGVAIDIGTTTIAMELCELASGRTCAQDSRINHQRAYGADVISRIQASVDGNGKLLKMSICRDLLSGILELTKQAEISAGQIKRMVISANTTMCHLLMGYPCDSLGASPFTPVNIQTIYTDVYSVMEEMLEGSIFTPDMAKQTELVILPGISAFVGADIVAGLLVCDFAKSEDICMLIDLGTNGEMAIGNKFRRIATSTAAGPAFEGGNISCGTGSVKGAIYAVTLEDKAMAYKTIGNEAPVGICGTGVMDITAELIKHEIVDETGLLCDEYFETGVPVGKKSCGEPIVFTQKDVREIQLAKAAVRAGIEVLLKRFGTDCSSLKTIYLSGGFGFRLDVEKAIFVGLLPEGFGGKICIAGNSSLAGAKACLLHADCLKTAKVLAEETEEISLGNDADFNDYYMDAMCFEQ